MQTDSKMVIALAPNGLLPKENWSRFQLTREIPKNLNHRAIERAVESFIDEVDVKGDKLGFFNQTLQKIAAATFLKVAGQDFWLATHNGEVAGYVCGSVVVDIDGSLCYWLSQCWVDINFRNKPCIKEGWQAILEQAKKYMCRYTVIVGSRNPEAYCRWLGHGAHVYSTLIKINLGV